MLCFLAVVDGKRVFYGTLNVMGKTVIFNATEKGGEIVDITGNIINKFGCFEPFDELSILREVAQIKLDELLGEKSKRRFVVNK